MLISRKIEGCRLIGVIADEETCIGFLLAGIGESDSKGRTNFMSVQQDTPIKDIDNFFNYLHNRKDIGIILITNDVANQIPKTIINANKQIIPVILNIPSKNQ